MLGLCGQLNYLFSLKNYHPCRYLNPGPPWHQTDMLPTELSWLGCFQYYYSISFGTFQLITAEVFSSFLKWNKKILLKENLPMETTKTSLNQSCFDWRLTFEGDIKWEKSIGSPSSLKALILSSEIFSDSALFFLPVKTWDTHVDIPTGALL